MRVLAGAGFDVVAGARRIDRLEALSAETGCRSMRLDVSDLKSIESFAAQVPAAHVLVNNAGVSERLRPIAEAMAEEWRTMWETNVLGLVWMTRNLLPQLEASGDGHIVNIGSAAAVEVYPDGGGYISTKHAVRAVSRNLRIELLDKPIRVTQIDPGTTITEIQLKRLGSAEAADKYHEGYTPLSSEDIANCVAFAVTQPSHMNIDEMLVRPRAQANIGNVYRTTSTE